ncbi:Replicase polyprotein 1ab [Plantactinospora veratri]|uniref:Replicase polyprotein 1ab n=1 Tax=Plantactinospora veratri TaxID=1436122 RepID=A0ABU7S8X8_9ACTN
MLSLAKPVAETVARHLVATGALIDDDPGLALEHALAARSLAARIAPVREAVGLAAYRAGEWQTALAELRTYHRMSGRQTHLAVLADCERALGRPERAIDLYRGADRESLDPAGAVELLIVAAGARGDMGQGDAAVAMLQVRELTATPAEPWTARLRYAYADALLAVDRREEAREWFARAAEVDEFGETDAAERLLELDGVVLEGDEDEDGYDDTADGGSDGSEPMADVDADASQDGPAPEDDEDGYDDEVARTDRDDDEFDDDEDELDDDEDEDEPLAAVEVTAADAEAEPSETGVAEAEASETGAAEAEASETGAPGAETAAVESAAVDAPEAEADPGARPGRGADS